MRLQISSRQGLKQNIASIRIVNKNVSLHIRALNYSGAQIGQQESNYRRTLKVRASAYSPDSSAKAINLSQEQDFPAVIPGTEIFPGNSSPSRPDLVPSEGARERMESLKATLLSKEDVPKEDTLPQLSSVQNVVDNTLHSASKQIEEFASRLSSLQNSTSRDLSEVWKSAKGYAAQESANLDSFVQDQAREAEKVIAEVQQTVMQQVPPEFADNASRGKYFGVFEWSRRVDLNSSSCMTCSNRHPSNIGACDRK